jgi:hypothetical protein
MKLKISDVIIPAKAPIHKGHPDLMITKVDVYIPTKANKGKKIAVNRSANIPRNFDLNICII